MARRFLVAVLFLVSSGLPLAAQTVAVQSGDTGLDGALNSLNLQAKADSGSFTVQLSADYGVKQSQLQVWLSAEKLGCGSQGDGHQAGLRRVQVPQGGRGRARQEAQGEKEKVAWRA
jgi:hypothetical protein